MDNKDMKPVDGGAPVLIPQGNMNANAPGTYGYMQNELKKNQIRSKNSISSIPNYKCGYGGACSEYFKLINDAMSGEK